MRRMKRMERLLTIKERGVLIEMVMRSRVVLKTMG